MSRVRMPLDFSERRLRSLVAEISNFSQADKEEILAQLPIDHRIRVEELLGAISEREFEPPTKHLEGAPPRSAPDLIFSYVGLSPWLTERLADHGENLEISSRTSPTDRSRFRMTARASDVLRASAEPFLDNSPLVEWPEEPADLGWIQRIKAAFFPLGQRT